MIRSKKELDFYIQADRMMNLGYFKPTLMQRIKNVVWPNRVMSFLYLMRKCQYHNKPDILNRIAYICYKRRYNRLALRLGFTIGPDVFGYGLVIPHYGTIIVGPSNTAGNYCVLNAPLCISDNGKKLGDGLYIGTGAKLTSKITLGNNISIAANSVVNKSFEQGNLLLAGTPAVIKREVQAWYVRDGEPYLSQVKACESLRNKLGLTQVMPQR